MNETTFTLAVQEVIELEMKAIDKIVAEEIEPLGDFGNPEKLIGKPYEVWTPEDKMMLGQIYGPEPNTLSRLIMKKEMAQIEEQGEILKGRITQ